MWNVGCFDWAKLGVSECTRGCERQDLPELARPQQGAHLLLLKGLAQGGMGELYLAASGDIEGAERPCVVKVVRRERGGDASFLARFLDEARIQAQMQHPGVAQILEAAIDAEGKPYVVVEHVAGHDLAEVRTRAEQVKRPIHWADAIAIAVALAEALAHVHERTGADGKALYVVHRDLSPHNIMLSYGGEVKLIDFGTARGENRRNQTVNGVVFAKPGYVAPEVLSQSRVDTSADLYALGIVLWELTAGRRFLQTDPATHLARVARGELRPAALAPWMNVPTELDRVVARLTAPRVADRFKSARGALCALVGLLKQAPVKSGERSVRCRVARLMLGLYPGEQEQRRAEFAELLTQARQREQAAKPQPPHKPPARAATCSDASLGEGHLAGTRYRLQRVLSASPSSPVFEAEHLDLKRRTVVKLLGEAVRSDSKWVERFQREAELTAAVEHPNLVRVYDYGRTAEGVPYYAMESLQGQTLQAVLDGESPARYEDVVAWGVQACRALRCLHDRGVVHRDVKPSNLFVTERGVLKLLDLGTAMRAGVEESWQSGALQLVGTPDYMAPEQVAQQSVDARADLYSLGCVLFALLTGHPPHAGDTTVALLANKYLGSTRWSRATRRNPSSSGLRTLVDRLLATDARRRPPTASEVEQHLLRLPTRTGGRNKARRARRAYGLSAAALAAAVSSTWIGPPPAAADALDWARRQGAAATQALRQQAARLEARLPEFSARGALDPLGDGWPSRLGELLRAVQGFAAEAVAQPPKPQGALSGSGEEDSLEPKPAAARSAEAAPSAERPATDAQAAEFAEL